MPNYRVATFARYAELLGHDSLDLSLPESTTVKELVAALKRLPGGDRLPTKPLMAVNHQIADPDQRVVATDEVALLPPLAGG